VQKFTAQTMSTPGNAPALTPHLKHFDGITNHYVNYILHTTYYTPGGSCHLKNLPFSPISGSQNAPSLFGTDAREGHSEKAKKSVSSLKTAASGRVFGRAVLEMHQVSPKNGYFSPISELNK
jgi:hypothetical protein